MEIILSDYTVKIDPDRATRVINKTNHIIAIRDSIDGTWMAPSCEDSRIFVGRMAEIEKLIKSVLGEVSRTPKKRLMIIGTEILPS